jgi:carboxyl-terminal processing protease
MKKIFLFLIILSAFSSLGQTEDNLFFCRQVAQLQEIITTNHVAPKPVDDSLSTGVYKLFIQKLNETYWFFLKSDMDEFNKDRLAFDDYIKSGSCDFIDKYVTIYSQRLEDAKKYVLELKNIRPDYSGKDSVTFGNPNYQKNFKDSLAAQDSWKRRIAYDVLAKITEQDSVLTHLESNLDSLVTLNLPLVIENQLCLFQEIQNQHGGTELYVKEAFLNALANYQDPNTYFFSPNDKDNFESSLSTNQLTFGVYPDKNEKGEIEVLYVAPGSVAHKNGAIEESDIIKEMYSISLGKHLETNCISLDEIYSFLNDSNNETVLFKIKKKNGDFKEIELTKGILKSPENLTRGYVVKKEIPMGYINIPSFYTDMESPNGQGVANDVAKEIFKLEKADIQGLILDLRFNGGGSIREAIDLCGMFIDQGPVAIFKGRDNSMESFEDYNKGMLFSKPIVLIINGYSASASEFFAATMQDYQRAIVVGAESYGKSSSQMVLPLSHFQDMGYCKVTTNRFYRINGASNQSVGVIPDIPFPSVYEGLETSEKYLDFVLANDSISEVEAFQPMKIRALDKIIDRSKLRVAKSPSFQFIKEVNTAVREGYFDEDRSFPLTLKDVYGDIADYQEIWSLFEVHFNIKRTEISASNSPSVEEILNYNEEEKELNTMMLEGISEDIYIDEAYRVLLDQLSLNKK